MTPAAATSPWIRVVERLGVATAVLGVVLYFIGQFGAWAGRRWERAEETIVKPVVTEHIRFLKSSSETMKAIGKTQEKIVNSQERIEARLIKEDREKAETREPN